MTSIRLVIADDHKLVREGLVALLERESDICVLAQARDGMELMRHCREFEPDVALVDLCMPGLNGLEAIQHMHKEAWGPRCIALSVQADAPQVRQVLDAGARGYLLKHNSYEELARGVRNVMLGQVFVSGELMGALLQPQATPSRDSHRLTPRERQMVQLLSEGYSAQEIASQLHLSAKTVATHRENVFAKLQIHGIAELTRFALREGISSLDVHRSRQGAGH